MAEITGIGGIFLYSDDPDADTNWYEDKLGFKRSEYGIVPFKWRHDDDPSREGTTEWSHIKRSSGYFGNSTANIMINYRVDDLDELIGELEAKEVEILGRENNEFGKFAWINDNQGIRIELWEPAEGM
jgi:lactoylglutathione lyase